MEEKQSKLKSYEYVHIPLWLVKDTCWMLEWKTLGTIMIVPTVMVAAYLAGKTKGITDFYVNLAVLFWISANAWWMCCEFFGMLPMKNLAGIPFVLGMLSMLWYYFKQKRGGQEV